MTDESGITDGTISSFRQRRDRILAGKIVALAKLKQRPVSIFDVGGRRDYWNNVGFEGISSITLLNIDPSDLGRATAREDIFTDSIGDARHLEGISNQAFDLYHSNSVIEHVGSWGDMKRMAQESRRVADSGWLQTPAWEFPIEPHFESVVKSRSAAFVSILRYDNRKGLSAAQKLCHNMVGHDDHRVSP